MDKLRIVGGIWRSEISYSRVRACTIAALYRKPGAGSAHTSPPSISPVRIRDGQSGKIGLWLGHNVGAADDAEKLSSSPASPTLSAGSSASIGRSGRASAWQSETR